MTASKAVMIEATLGLTASVEVVYPLDWEMRLAKRDLALTGLDLVDPHCKF